MGTRRLLPQSFLFATGGGLVSHLGHHSAHTTGWDAAGFRLLFLFSMIELCTAVLLAIEFYEPEVM
jgi:hypothetical protein